MSDKDKKKTKKIKIGGKDITITEGVHKHEKKPKKKPTKLKDKLKKIKVTPSPPFWCHPRAL